MPHPLTTFCDIPTAEVLKAHDAMDMSASLSVEQVESLEELRELVSMLEITASSTASRYRRALSQHQVTPDAIHEIDETIDKVLQQLRRLHHYKIRGQTWQGGEAEKWHTLFLGTRRRLSLPEIVRKVVVENRIVRHWQNHVLCSKMRKRSSDSLLVPLSNSHSHFAKLDITSWHGADVFEIEKDNQQPLATIFMSIWQQRDLDSLSKARKTQVLDYIKAVESGYLENPYHNRMHAADVTLMAYYFWISLSAMDSFAGYFAEVDLLVLIVAAAIHDLAHPAVNNDFLVKTRSALATRYHDRAVLENFHAASAFELMKDKGVPLLEHNLPAPPASSLRGRIVDMILATDMAVHKTIVEEMETATKRNQNKQDIDKLTLERGLVHMADIGHPLRSVAQHQDWARRVTEEFFAQGDKEKDRGLTPISLFDRKQAPPLAKSQIGFLRFVVQPMFNPICGLLGPAGHEPQLCLEMNMKAWQAIAEREEPTNNAAGGC